MRITQQQLSLNDAYWIDINTQYTKNGLPDRLPDGPAITLSSLFNLFNCIPGERARTFQPEYGSMWRKFIHEPITDMTASKMRIFMIQSIKRWEPRIALDISNSYVKADTTIPGYIIRIAFSLPGSSSSQQIQFEVAQ